MLYKKNRRSGRHNYRTRSTRRSRMAGLESLEMRELLAADVRLNALNELGDASIKQASIPASEAHAQLRSVRKSFAESAMPTATTASELSPSETKRALYLAIASSQDEPQFEIMAGVTYYVALLHSDVSQEELENASQELSAAIDEVSPPRESIRRPTMNSIRLISFHNSSLTLPIPY